MRKLGLIAKIVVPLAIALGGVGFFYFLLGKALWNLAFPAH